jgi:hypothetical protein
VIESAQGPHPDVADSWYVDFLEWIRDTAHPVFGPLVSSRELVIGALLILGLFTGIAALWGRSSTSGSSSPARPGSTRPS